jgi:hypothetical protein
VLLDEPVSEHPLFHVFKYAKKSETTAAVTRANIYSLDSLPRRDFGFS